MSVTFRRMKLEDVPQVVELERKIFKDAWSAESFFNEIENKTISYPCVAEENGEMVGYAVSWYFSGELHISNIAVRPELRRRGYGRRLLEHLLQRFPKHEIAFLEVRKSNQAAINLYLKYKFRKLYLREHYYSDGEDAYVMVRENKL